MPKELVEPFVDYVSAQKAGLEVVGSLEELIERLPNSEGNAGTGALINNVDFRLLYKNGGSLYNDLVALNKQKKNLLMKLINRCCDVMLRCQGATLERIFWGIGGKAAGKQTNFQELVLLLSRVDSTLFSVPQRNTINGKLYRMKIVDAMHFL